MKEKSLQSTVLFFLCFLWIFLLASNLNGAYASLLFLCSLCLCCLRKTYSMNKKKSSYLVFSPSSDVPAQGYLGFSQSTGWQKIVEPVHRTVDEFGASEWKPKGSGFPLITTLTHANHWLGRSTHQILRWQIIWWRWGSWVGAIVFVLFNWLMDTTTW